MRVKGEGVGSGGWGRRAEGNAKGVVAIGAEEGKRGGLRRVGGVSEFTEEPEG